MSGVLIPMIFFGWWGRGGKKRTCIKLKMKILIKGTKFLIKDYRIKLCVDSRSDLAGQSWSIKLCVNQYVHHRQTPNMVQTSIIFYFYFLFLNIRPHVFRLWWYGMWLIDVDDIRIIKKKQSSWIYRNILT